MHYLFKLLLINISWQPHPLYLRSGRCFYQGKSCMLGYHDILQWIEAANFCLDEVEKYVKCVISLSICRV